MSRALVWGSVRQEGITGGRSTFPLPHGHVPRQIHPKWKIATQLTSLRKLHMYGRVAHLYPLYLSVRLSVDALVVSGVGQGGAERLALGDRAVGPSERLVRRQVKRALRVT